MTLRVAIIGAGPAGFFLAERLLSQSTADRPVEVDMFERLPVPYGLVRFGVAPDHEKIKAVTRSFDKVASKPGFRYFGNVEIGSALTLDDLRNNYHAVAFTTGAQSDRRMNIPGEDLMGSHAATEFVAWYNGHPDYRDRQFDLSAERVAVVGVGNVAVDVARILSKTPEELAKTDIADYALEALQKSRVKEVYLLGRRGPAQAAFTPPEVKELGELIDADALAIPEEVALDELSAAAVAGSDDATLRRKVETVSEFAKRSATGKNKRLHLRFLVSPTELMGSQGKVSGIRLVKNRLVSRNGDIVAEPTGHEETLDVGLVFRSVGYRGLEIAGLPFDPKTGTVPNVGGRVSPGLYVAGWIKRGPSGVIGTNKPDAAETAAAILEDAPALERSLPPKEAIVGLLESRGVKPVTWERWVAINAAETGRGSPAGRPRIKFCSIDEMLAAC